MFSAYLPSNGVPFIRPSARVLGTFEQRPSIAIITWTGYHVVEPRAVVGDVRPLGSAEQEQFVTWLGKPPAVRQWSIGTMVQCPQTTFRCVSRPLFRLQRVSAASLGLAIVSQRQSGTDRLVLCSHVILFFFAESSRQCTRLLQLRSCVRVVV